ncbi:hypothetical protein BDW62DRAFT_179019 [Aspergillus aurantiobrunneus]
MDVLLPNKTAPKRRNSLSRLFGSQRPTFATLDNKPTRHYDFVDTPGQPKFLSHLIDRQNISPDLESQIRYSCSLLAYRIEQGVPSLPNDQVGRRAVRNGPAENIATKAQIVSKYPSSKAGPEGALITGYDSGVGLTQQPSMQTMRVLHSRSGDASDSGDTRSASVFSNTRTGTSCSNTSAINSTELSCTQSSSHSPRENELQSLTGTNITGYTQQQNHATKSFLTDSSPSDPQPYEKVSPEDVEVFLNPTGTIITNLSSETISTQSSPSLGLFRVAALNQQPTTSNPESETANTNSRSIIIDKTGHARLLTPDEESQRNTALQEAVLARMTLGFMRHNPIREPPRRQYEQGSPILNNTSSRTNCDSDSQSRPRSSSSRFGFSWFGIKTDLGVFKRKNQHHDQGPKLGRGMSFFGKLSRFFSRQRSSSSFGGR